MIKKDSYRGVYIEINNKSFEVYELTPIFLNKSVVLSGACEDGYTLKEIKNKIDELFTLNNIKDQ